MLPLEALPVYPNCPAITRIVRVGGMSKPELLAEFHARGIELNEAARRLFAHDSFTTSDVASLAHTVEVSVVDLGCIRGASGRAWPVFVSSRTRSASADSASRPAGGLHRLFAIAALGAITVASMQLSDDDGIPKGLYLRRINGVLWLRGYWSGPDHIWSPENRLVFGGSHVADPDQASPSAQWMLAE
jgi:hypothetical protein